MQELEIYINTLKANDLYMVAQSCVMVGVLELESLSSISWFIVIEAWYTFLQLTQPTYQK